MNLIYLFVVFVSIAKLKEQKKTNKQKQIQKTAVFGNNKLSLNITMKLKVKKKYLSVVYLYAFYTN